MFYRNTKWAERYAAGQASQFMPGLAPGPRGFRVLKYGRDDFDSGSEFFWFYMHYLVITLGTLLAVALVVILIAIYASPPSDRHPDWRFLVLSLLPSVAIFIWLCVDGSVDTCMKPWPRLRLAIEALVLSGSTACVCVFGSAFAEVPRGAYYAGWYAAMLGFLVVLVFTRIIRMAELIIGALEKPRARRSQRDTAQV